jgi:hypothetical protein
MDIVRTSELRKGNQCNLPLPRSSVVFHEIKRGTSMAQAKASPEIGKSILVRDFLTEELG